MIGLNILILMKVGLKWKISFAIITIVAITGLFWKPVTDLPNTGMFLSEDNIVNSDVAWILAVQQVLHQVRRLMFRHILRVAVGALQERRICVAK